MNPSSFFVDEREETDRSVTGNGTSAPVNCRGSLKEMMKENEVDDTGFFKQFFRNEEIRNKFLDEEGKCQSDSPKSTSGWMKTLFVLNARALHLVFFPWCVATLHAIFYSCLFFEVYDVSEDNITTGWQNIFTFALNTTLGFLLVFRLNRSAVRFWYSRELWGKTVVCVRHLVAKLLVNCDHDPINRDEALRWLMAFPLTAKDYIRGDNCLGKDGYAGILSNHEIRELGKSHHPPSTVVLRIRHSIRTIFYVSESTSVALAVSRTQHLNSMELDIDDLVNAQGSMERVKDTPLPLVYVTHLRTFVLINLLLMPYVWGPVWGWYTTVIVPLVAFAFLGIEAAAAEVGIPFNKDSPNGINMDRICKGILANTKELLLSFGAVSGGHQQQIGS